MSSLKSRMAGKQSGGVASTKDHLGKAEAVTATSLLKAKTLELKHATKEARKSIKEGLAEASAAVAELKAKRAPASKAPARKKAVQGHLDSDPSLIDVSEIKGMFGKAKKKVSIVDMNLAHASSDFMAPKEKVKREIFTIPPSENALIDDIRSRAAAKKVFTNRSAITRAAISALASLDDKQVLAALGRIRVIKSGRSD
ncbi:MAG: hypothetical protein KJ614_01985 [Gammaproteobacteria bacterium]|uniref:hypothetical protein n=1 Tax=Rhodoferax sp. TaxID=50421 RepID=UPI00183AFB00|nr:hypothetical protein [Rhodoferax sp.]MBU3897693.1 hypothetical protein [Gammaproteobacteria bacterium]MBA3056334.1 hypothetical protein [Rhodoferax sp.]MBU4080069.1 hypothetical protein [Gammaproteobacteria bacterium]MBU4112188.1 hypothetical protein [Gammaproteobacteria bacterium]MBU4172347.1 hypothetical protein [Gammaproteobacteria bacterium]